MVIVYWHTYFVLGNSALMGCMFACILLFSINIVIYFFSSSSNSNSSH